MRVVAGRYGSRPLRPVPGQNTRPTTDKIKESIFNLLGGTLDGGLVLDLYAGTGGLAIEAVSRGADFAVLCEKHRQAIQTIEANIAITKEPERFQVLKGDNRASLTTWQAAHPEKIFDYVFLDPPYAKQALVADIEWLAGQGLVDEITDIIVECDQHTQLPNQVAGFDLVKAKSYGQTQILIYRGGS